jgi:hypothetical protein
LKLSGSSSYLCLGFGSINVFGNSAQSQSEIILYQCHGIIYEGGTSKNIGVTSTSGDLINCEVDFIENKAAWFKNGA